MPGLDELLVQFSVLAAITLPLALLTQWLLSRRWLAHLPPPRPPGRCRTLAADTLLGAVLALAILAVAVLPGVLSGGFSPGGSWQPFEYILPDETNPALKLSWFFAVQSLWEELFFRSLGVGLLAMLMLWAAELATLPEPLRRFGTLRAPDVNPLEQRRRVRLWLWLGGAAVAIVGVGFAAVHAGNPEFTLLAGINVALAGIWLGLLFIAQGHVLGAWAAHFAWNIALALAALPVSGIPMAPAPLGFGFSGAREGILSGGAFGPEASIGAGIGLTLAIGWLSWRIWRDARAALQPDVEQFQPAALDEPVSTA